MCNISRDGEYVTITERDPRSLPSPTSEAPDAGDPLVYRAKKTDFIVINEHAEEVGKVPGEELIQALRGNFAAVYNISKDGEYVTITESDPRSLPSPTSEAPDAGGPLVYRAKKTDFIVVNGHAEEVGKAPGEELIQALRGNFTAVYNISKDGEYVTVTECDPRSLPSPTSGVQDTGGRLVYRAKKTDPIVINGHAEEVAKVSGKELIQALHDKSALR